MGGNCKEMMRRIGIVMTGERNRNASRSVRIGQVESSLFITVKKSEG